MPTQNEALNSDELTQNEGPLIRPTQINKVVADEVGRLREGAGKRLASRDAEVPGKLALTPPVRWPDWGSGLGLPDI